jgi:hypothetical protein
LGDGVELPDRFNVVPREFRPDGIVPREREHVEDPSPDGEVAVRLHEIFLLEPGLPQAPERLGETGAFTLLHVDDVPGDCRGGRERHRQSTGRGDNDRFRQFHQRPECLHVSDARVARAHVARGGRGGKEPHGIGTQEQGQIVARALGGGVVPRDVENLACTAVA